MKWTTPEGVSRYKKFDGIRHRKMTCRVCGRAVKPAQWSRICDGCWPEYEKAQQALRNARWRARQKLRRTMLILTRGRGDG